MSKKLQFKTAKLELQQQDSMYVVDIAYPKAKGFNSKRLSGYIQEQAQHNVKEFRAFIQNYPAFAQRDLTGEYEFAFQNDNLLSIRQQYTWAVPGVSILLQYFGNVNYDLKQEKPLRLNDIFKENTDYQATLRQLLTQQINERFHETNCGLYSKEKFKNFTIHKDYLTFYLDIYQGSPECQTESFAVSYSDLQSLLRSEFLIAVATASQRP